MIDTKELRKRLQNDHCAILGIITFEPDYDTVFSASCLRDIIDFIENHVGKP